MYLKIARLPQGPTLTFWIRNYSLSRDVISSMKKQFVFEKLYQNAPLIVLNSLSGEGLHMKLMASMFQNMFPTINITKVRKAHLREGIIRAFNSSFCSGSVSMFVYLSGLLMLGNLCVTGEVEQHPALCTPEL